MHHPALACAILIIGAYAQAATPPTPDADIGCDPGEQCPGMACGFQPGMCGLPPTHCGPCVDCPALDPSSPSGMLVAKVVNAASGAGIGNARLIFPAGTAVGPTSTPFLWRLPPGKVRVRVEAQGYEPLEEVVSIEPCRLRREFRLEPIIAKAPGVSCDRRLVRCKQAEPTCPPGQVAQVVDGCFGACADAEQCACLEKAACPEPTTCGRNGHCAPLMLSCDRRSLACRKPERACPQGLVRSIPGSCFGPCIFPTACICAQGERCPDGYRCGRGGVCRSK